MGFTYPHSSLVCVARSKSQHARCDLRSAPACQLIAERIEASDVDAFAVMDYWTFDGYFALRDYLNRNPSLTKKRIFPGIELRLEAPTDYRLNTHVVFNDSLSNDKLAHFLARLSIGGLQDKPRTVKTLLNWVEASMTESSEYITVSQPTVPTTIRCA